MTRQMGCRDGERASAIRNAAAYPIGVYGISGILDR